MGFRRRWRRSKKCSFTYKTRAGKRTDVTLRGSDREDQRRVRPRARICTSAAAATASCSSRRSQDGMVRMLIPD